VERELVSGRIAGALSLVALAACVLTLGHSAAIFTDGSRNPQTVAAAADFVAPSAVAVTVAGPEGAGGFVEPGRAYYVYADVAESGNPASGVASVRADVSALSSGQTAVALAPGSYRLGEDAYGYRSRRLSADAGLGPGAAVSCMLALVDLAGNSGSQDFAAIVEGDAGAAAGSDPAAPEAEPALGPAQPG
jgi:hypothetical protein